MNFKPLIFFILCILFFSGTSSAWLSGFTYEKNVTLNTTVASTLTNFPAYFIVDTASLVTAGKMQSNCADLRVTDTSDTLLKYEITNCNNSATVVFVKIASFTNNTVFLYYGNTTAADASDKVNTWTSYDDVWHFEETATAFNSATNGLNISFGGSTTTNCKFGKCYGAGTTTATAVNSKYDVATALSMSCWVYPGNTAIGIIMGQRQNAAGAARWLYFKAATPQYLTFWNGSGSGNASNTTIGASLTYVGGVFDGTRLRMYQNGAQTLNITESAGATEPNFIIGGDQGNGEPFVGSIDECRIYKGNRTADWMNAEYGQVYSVGTENINVVSPSLSVSIPNANETENKTMTINLTAGTYNITAYNVSVTYNNTVVYTATASGLNTNLSTLTTTMIAPLVSANMTNISWTVYANVSASTITNLNASGNQSVQTWWTPAILQSPANNSVLSVYSLYLYIGINSTNFSGVSKPVTCNLTINGVTPWVTTAHYTTATNISYPGNFNAGTNTWSYSCYPDDTPGFVRTTPTYTFTVVNYSYDNVLILDNVENILNSPQEMFYDTSGALNVLYFVDTTNTTNTLRIKTIVNNSVTANYSALLNATKSFYVVFRESAETLLLTYRTDNATTQFMHLNGGLTFDSAATANNVQTNSFYDPYTYANTKQFDTISYNASSYFLFIQPNAAGSKLIQKNASLMTLTEQATASHNRVVTWQTIANNSNLNQWYYAFPAANNATTDFIYIYSWNGTASTLIASPDTEAYNQSAIEKSIVIFDSYENYTYAMITNATSKAILHLINENKTYQLNYTIASPSNIFFIDKYTFVFFSNESGTVYAYSCYFGSTPTCNRFSSTDYGIIVPYDRGAMTTAKRVSTNDYVTRGAVSTATYGGFIGYKTILIYNQHVYDAKFICYDEILEYRKLGYVRIYSDNNSIMQQSSSWGYVIPSSLIGNGTKRFYSTCDNGTQRLYLVGLTGSYRTDFYSLNTTQGAYYTLKAVNQFGSPISNVTITVLRVSNLKQAFVTIEQGITDYSGSAVFFLQPYNFYKVMMDAQGYIVLNFDYVPSSTTTLTAVLNQNGTTIAPLNDFAQVWNDVSYQVTPAFTFTNTSTNLTLTIASSSSSLQYFGMNVTKYYNGTTTTVYSNQQNSSPAGGSLQYTASAVGTYTIQPWFKLQNYSEYEPLPSKVQIGNITGLKTAIDDMNTSKPISGWAWYFIALIVAAVAAGFVSRYTIDGAGFIALAVLWIFSLIYAEPVVCLAGGLCLTGIHITTVATVMVLAGSYLRWYG